MVLCMLNLKLNDWEKNPSTSFLVAASETKRLLLAVTWISLADHYPTSRKTTWRKLPEGESYAQVL